MSPEDIRDLDGTALTRLAWELGLHDLHGSSFTYEEVCVTTRSPWQPHLDLAQADAIFRGLRKRGWCCGIFWDPQTQSGAVNVHLPPDARSTHLAVTFGGPGQPTEAHALLLVSVLAMASQEGTP